MDLLELVDLYQPQEGVAICTGFCEARPAFVDDNGTGMYIGPDTAYRLSNLAHLSGALSDELQTKFPIDYSVLMTIRPEKVTILQTDN